MKAACALVITVLSFGQTANKGAPAPKAAKPPIGDPSKPLFFFMDSWVSASGRWKAASGNSGDDLGKHEVEIHCRLDIKECLEAEATIVSGEPQVSVQYYRIIEWDKNGIIAEDDSPICTTNRLLINFQDQSVMAVDAPKKMQKECPSAMERTPVN